ncbi:ATP-binding cassette domain-containing protein [Staphylococcus pragensis]|uniref:ATP-binding cassette domain-containing protein n=1 Tax=Staphylococcus pragensis TaxID=1611836 RepID=A0A4Z1BIZ6_9STAP|nr:MULTISPECIES: ATP-binding cassette domain-containing protein [Staphylococcus]RTX89302.1 ATP-binding cassette domain-containing protein [Staphylococcus carnosus]TGN27627.1 ATP-binding cassette domain-containing protein [Staphylococcus pragensis]GGG91278.1 molybdenum ABC transporter ATP-binding protein [Staphylococcus pragensis]
MLKLKLQYQLKKTFIDININDAAPKIYAIRGPSGIGKTTVLNMIAGLRKPDSAYIKINDHVILDTNKNVNVKIQDRRIGYLFQDYQLFPNMTVRKNITFMAKPSVHIEDLTNQLNIRHLMDQYPATLSGGEAQRVALARTLSTKPDLVLLDEPFSSLDENTRDEGIKLVKRVFKEWKIPIIFVTHSNFEAEVLADKIVKID